MQEYLQKQEFAQIDLKSHSRLRTWRKVRTTIEPYLWLIPSLLLILLFTMYPVYELFVTSFSKIDLAGMSQGFAGFENFIHLVKERVFPHILLNTLIWTVAIVFISVIASIAIALLLNQDFAGRKLVRAALIIPWAASLLITASIWKWVFDYNYGTLNTILKDLHLIHSNIYWLANYHSSFPVMIWIGIFVTLPFATFVILAGLQTIPSDLYEAADVDGASTWQQFWHITLPSLKQPIMVSTVLNTIYVFNSFPIIWTVTQGGPANTTNTLITYLYTLAFQVNNMGEAAAASVLSFILLLVFSIGYGIFVLREG